MNEPYFAAIKRFRNRVVTNAEIMVFGVAKELHERLVSTTPYRTGRARASWNLSPHVSDDQPAPDIGFGRSNATEAELASANVFYDSLIRAKGSLTIADAELVMHVTNTVPYIERLNNGHSQQAPAGFFQANVAGADIIAVGVARGLRT